MLLGNRQLSRLRVNQGLASLPNLEVTPLSESRDETLIICVVAERAPGAHGKRFTQRDVLG
jgi:hypothetical protein